jgi:hypothetical protein
MSVPVDCTASNSCANSVVKVVCLTMEAVPRDRYLSLKSAMVANLNALHIATRAACCCHFSETVGVANPLGGQSKRPATTAGGNRQHIACTIKSTGAFSSPTVKRESASCQITSSRHCEISAGSNVKGDRR